MGGVMSNPAFIPGGPCGWIKGANDEGRAVLAKYGFRSLEELKYCGRITVWSRWDHERKTWEHNHWNFGQDASVTHPVASHPDNVKTWKGGKWAYQFAEIFHGVIVNKQPMVFCTK
jgi:hypothetical protein